MSRKTKGGIILAGLSVVALALTGCSAGNGGSSSSSSPSSTEASSLPSTGWASADRADIKDGGSLTLPVDAFIQNFHLLQADSGTVDDNIIDGLYYASYVTIKEDGSWEANPDYATSVELKSEDPQVVELKINPEAVWSDGTPMSYKDIEASWKAYNGTNPDFAPLATNVWEDVKSVTAGENDQDVLIEFQNKNADWPSVLTGIEPSWSIATPEAFNTSWAKGPFAADGTTYVSGGPFIVTKVDSTGQVLTFERNPKWWGDTPKLDRVIFKTVSRDGRAQAFGNKEIDALNINGDTDAFATAQKRADSKIERSLGTTYRHITLNGTSSVFKDVRVRHAFAQALDRSTLAQAILSGVKSPVTLLNNLIYMPGQDGYTDDASKLVGNGADAAKKLLTDAGYTFNDDGYAVKDGKVLTVRFVIPSQVQNSANVATLAQAETKKAGFKVKIDTVPSADYFSKYITVPARDFDATYFAWQGTAFPVSSTKSIFYPASSGQNYGGVTDKSLGKLFDEANADLDPQSRIKTAHTIDKKLVGLFTTIPLFAEPYAWAVKDGLVNYGPAQFQSTMWQNVGWKK